MTAVQHATRRPAARTGAALFAAATATAVVFGTVTATASAGPGEAAAVGRAAECAEVEGKLERLEGRLTPNACAFIRRQIAFGEIPTGTPPAPGDLTHPRVRAYLDIFDESATLWEAGTAPQHGTATIGTSITGSLRLVPDFRYRGTEVVADGAVMMFGQWNEATVKGHRIAYPQIARNVLGDDGRTIQARRYYDRHELVKPVAPELRPLFDGVTDPAGAATGTGGHGPERFRADEITARLAAWNGEDVAALAGRMGNARLAGPGLAAPLTTAEGRSAYLKRLFERADFRFASGQIAFGRTMTYVEWHGTAVVKTVKDGVETVRDVPFGIIERFGPDSEWELFFDTLPLIADQSRIGEYFQRLTQP
ncbi:hypothetical protein ACWEQL_38585 [Kitasatospora sp. NPDC004240]